MNLEENRKRVNALIEAFLPRKLDRAFLERITGMEAEHYDLEALNKAITEPVWEFLDRGGKRWRPFLTAVCCEAVGGDTGKFAELLIITELLHNGTLIVDDVEDSSEKRRGKPCLHKVYGRDIALNAGNTLYYLPYTLVKMADLDEKKKNALYELINDDMLKLHIGQATDIYWHRSSKEVSEEEYLRMCANKTGAMARLAAKLGAIIGGGSGKQVNALGNFAETVGIAFQIQDDILNLEGGLGKEYGDDITEGKKSLPAIIASKEEPRLTEILGMQTNDKKLIDEAIAIIKKQRGIEKSRKLAAELVESSLKELETVLPESRAKASLKELAGFLIERSS
ncbi:polyprenyl synthetase family protein [Candidatus Woesearchaeota archaeon]|nr:polyprenyl synthetase family protein [Candidatus Woesearchaeota archaeon]